jgi:hypothetical protein
MEFEEFIDACSILEENIKNFNSCTYEEIQILIELHFDKKLNLNVIEKFVTKKEKLFKDNSYENEIVYQKMLFL